MQTRSSPRPTGTDECRGKSSAGGTTCQGRSSRAREARHHMAFLECAGASPAWPRPWAPLPEHRRGPLHAAPRQADLPGTADHRTEQLFGHLTLGIDERRRVDGIGVRDRIVGMRQPILERRWVGPGIGYVAWVRRLALRSPCQFPRPRSFRHISSPWRRWAAHAPRTDLPDAAAPGKLMPVARFPQTAQPGSSGPYRKEPRPEGRGERRKVSMW